MAGDARNARLSIAPEVQLLGTSLCAAAAWQGVATAGLHQQVWHQQQQSGSGIGGDLNPTGIGLGRRPETVFHSLRSRGMPTPASANCVPLAVGRLWPCALSHPPHAHKRAAHGERSLPTACLVGNGGEPARVVRGNVARHCAMHRGTSERGVGVRWEAGGRAHLAPGGLEKRATPSSDPVAGACGNR